MSFPLLTTSLLPSSVLARHACDLLGLAACDEVERPPLDLLKDASDVLAENAERDELQAAEEQHAGRDRRPAGHGAPLDELDVKHMKEQQDAQYAADEPRVKAQPQGHRRIGEDAVEREVQHLSWREFGNARKALGRNEADLHLTVAHGADHAANEARALAIAAKFQHDLAIHEAKIRAALLDVDARNLVERLVVPIRRRPLQETDALRRLTDRLHDVKTFFPLGKKRRNQRGWMLHVSVHHDDSRAVRVVETARQGKLMPEVAREEDGLHACILFLQTAQDLAAAVLGTVVDKDQLEIVLRRSHDLRNRLIKMFEIVLLVEYGDNDGNELQSFSPHFSAASKVIAPSL